MFRWTRLGVIVLVVGAIGAMAPTAGAAPTRNPVATVGSGELVEPAGLAVDKGTGNLYVADPGLGAVVRFGSSGTLAPFAASGSAELGGLTLPRTAAQVAVDNSGGASAGRFYVANGGAVEAFARTGASSNFTAGEAEYTAENRIVGFQFGQFGAISGVAVDAAGNIFVADEANRVIAVYRPTGKYLGYVNFGEVVGLGAGTAGRLYIVEGNGTVRRLDLEIPGVVGPEQIVSTIPARAGIAVDPATQRMLLVGRAEAAEYEAPAAGENPPPQGLRFTFGQDQLRGGAVGIAVDGSTKATKGSVYVSTGDHVDRFGAAFDAPTVVTEPASPVDSTARTATLRGTVNPEGRAVTGCEFEFGDTYEGTFEYVGSVPCAESPAAIGAGNAPVAVHADISRLEVGNYHFRLSASNAGGYLKGADRFFAILGTPTVEAQAAAPARTEALLSGTIGPENGRTTYRFEYGLSVAYGESSATSAIPAGRGQVRVSLPIVELTPGTTYHFRLVADNGYRTTYGADATFTTAPETGTGACPNETLRVGPSRTLGECRAYEMVSPPDKNGGSVYLLSNNPAAPSGEAIEFSSTSTFAGSPAASVSSYVARRGAEGWTTEGVDVPQLNRTAIVFGAAPASSEDLGETFATSLLALAPEAVEGQFNLYLRDNATGGLTTVATYPGELPYFQFTIVNPILAVAPDFSHIYFQSQSALLPGAIPPGGGSTNIYDVDHGRLKLVSRVSNLQGTEEVGVSGDFKGISGDGRKLFFRALQPGNEEMPNGLYMYEDGHSVLISGSQKEPRKAAAAEYGGTNQDGSVVYFIGEGLTEETRPPSSVLYRYEPDVRRLTAVTPALPEGQETGIRQVVGTSADGSYVYFLASGALAPGAEDVSEESSLNLFVLHEAARGQGQIRYIGRTEAGLSEAGIGGQVSPDGRHFAFSSTANLTSSPIAEECGGGGEYCAQIFEYSAEGAGSLVCVSCGGTTAGTATLGPPQVQYLLSAKAPRLVLDDGTVFFNSPDALVPADTNGVGDVYLWDGSAAHLVSTGTDGVASIFSDASADGRDVFFRTAQPLVGIDVDSRVDLYDARIGGGFAAQNPEAPVACEGEACRGPSPTPTPLVTSGSSGRPAVCDSFERAAKVAAKRVATLRRRARGAHGKQAEALRGRMKVAKRKAKTLHSRVGSCRRAGR